METFELYYLKKAFLQRGRHYENPRKEALSLRYLWTNEKPISRCQSKKEKRILYKKILNCIEDPERLQEAHQLITKGLKLHPRYHAFYAFRGKLYRREEKWTKAIKNYEIARVMLKFDLLLKEATTKFLYVQELRECYRERANWYYENGKLLEATSDYEQIMALKTGKKSTMIDIEDKLLQLLKELNKYDLFCHYWSDFMDRAGRLRKSKLLVIHAEYKFLLREIVPARQYLFEALQFDENNAKVHKLLQEVYKIGRTMATYAVIWCIHGSYDKALLTIEKCRECDPSNLGYVLVKTIALRLSGRLRQARACLEESSARIFDENDTHRKIAKKEAEPTIGSLSVEETKRRLISQWHLIKYDIVVQHMAKGNYKEANMLINQSYLKNLYVEPYLLQGDSFLLYGDVDSALKMYFECLEKARKSASWLDTRKRIMVVQRIANILNNRTYEVLQNRKWKQAVEMSDKVLKLLEDEGIDVKKLCVQRGRALMNKARGKLQLSDQQPSKECCTLVADSLRFTRGAENIGMYSLLYNSMAIEDVLNYFAPNRKLPHSLKILLQHS